MNGNTINEPDWGDRVFYDDPEVREDNEHAGYDSDNPNLLGFMTETQWVCSDADLDRALEMIQGVKTARGLS